jgi:hypothetical protein
MNNRAGIGGERSSEHGRASEETGNWPVSRYQGKPYIGNSWYAKLRLVMSKKYSKKSRSDQNCHKSSSSCHSPFLSQLTSHLPQTWFLDLIQFSFLESWSGGFTLIGWITPPRNGPLRESIFIAWITPLRQVIVWPSMKKQASIFVSQILFGRIFGNTWQFRCLHPYCGLISLSQQLCSWSTVPVSVWTNAASNSFLLLLPAQSDQIGIRIGDLRLDKGRFVSGSFLIQSSRIRLDFCVLMQFLVLIVITTLSNRWIWLIRSSWDHRIPI